MRIRTDADVNGNRIVHISTDKGGFSIQTLQNLPGLHGESIPHEREADYSEEREISVYVQEHGTERQRDIVNAGAKRYEELDADDPDYERKYDEQWDKAQEDAENGEVINLSDLMTNSGL